MDAFPNNPKVDGGWEAGKCNLQFAGPRIPMSMVTTYLTYSSLGMHNKDAQQCGLRQRGASTQNMSWGENANPLSGQSKCLENQLFILLQHFAGYTTLYDVDGQQVESMGTSPWCIIRDGHGPSALKTHWKPMLIYYSGVVFFHWRSAGIPRIIYPQSPGATAASATQQSHKDLGVFSWRRRDCGA